MACRRHRPVLRQMPVLHRRSLRGHPQPPAHRWRPRAGEEHRRAARRRAEGRHPIQARQAMVERRRQPDPHRRQVRLAERRPAPRRRTARRPTLQRIIRTVLVPEEARTRLLRRGHRQRGIARPTLLHRLRCAKWLSIKAHSTLPERSRLLSWRPRLHFRHKPPCSSLAESWRRPRAVPGLSAAQSFWLRVTATAPTAATVPTTATVRTTATAIIMRPETPARRATATRATGTMAMAVVRAMQIRLRHRHRHRHRRK